MLKSNKFTVAGKMFFKANLRKIRLTFKNKLRGKEEKYNIEGNVFIFDETSNDVVGLNEKLYDSVVEESITGKNITVGTFLMDRHGFNYEIMLTKYIRDALQFNLIPFSTKNATLLFNGIDFETIDFVSVAFSVRAIPDLQPTVPVQHELYMREPSAGILSTFFIRVFALNVWYAILCTILAGCFVIALYKRFVNKMVVNYIEMLFSTLGMSDILERNLMNISLRIECFFLSIFMLLIMGAFSTFLTAELTVKEIHLPFYNLEGILQQTEYSLCIPDGLFIKYIMKEHGYADFINGGNCPNHTFEEYDFVQSICNLPNTIYFSGDDDVYVEIVESYDGNPPCDTYVFKDRHYPAYRTMPTKSTFKYRRQISKVITRLRTSGILYNLYKKIIGKDKVNLKASIETSDLTPIQFGHIQLMLKTYIFLMLIGLTMLLLEIVWEALK